MSRTTRGNARRRISYLATSSFIATSILSGAGALTAILTPSVALANNECGAASNTPPNSNLLACSNPTYTSGLAFPGGKNLPATFCTQ